MATSEEQEQKLINEEYKVTSYNTQKQTKTNKNNQQTRETRIHRYNMTT